jgi:hypothetical protein
MSEMHDPGNDLPAGGWMSRPGEGGPHRMPVRLMRMKLTTAMKAAAQSPA